MSKQLCPECGKPLPTGSRDGTCPTCLLTLGLAAAFTPEHSGTLPSPAAPGDQIGRYKLLELIGEGGFGIVWMAEQQEPVRRKVALKILKLGMDTREVVARFEAERQALAMMDHANIAKVLDAGATENGRPFFVMELVGGVPITTFCDTRRLSTRERIELFVLVCEAVQHAHQKGVIHRDLKPGNILLSEQDGRFVPKVIDFGVAKALEEPLTDKTLFTRYQQFLGTPAYMSPEQAGLGGLDVDTRSDIYSLGVLLYELLTGKPPFDPHDLALANREALLKTIRETEPPKPSARLTTLSRGEITALAEQRRESAEQLPRLLRGELDWIILKALDKDRARRYATANGFAAELRRYLNGEAVTAAPPTVAYLFSKFARKNRIAIATGAAFAALLIAGIVATAWQAVRATNSARESGEQRDKAQAAEKTADLNAAETRQELYVAQIRLAQQAWQEGNLEQAGKMLEATIPATGQEDLRDFEWRYLRKLLRDESRLTFTNVYFRLTGWGMPAAAGGLAIDGQTLIVGSSNTIKWLDLENKREVRTQNLGSNVIWPWAVAMKRPGLLAYYADSIKTISPRGEPLLIDGLIHKSCRALAWSWDGELLASADPWSMKVVKLWDAKTGAQVGDDLHLGSGIASLAFSPDAKYLVCGDMDSKIQVFEAKTSKRVAELTNHTAIAHRLVFDPTGTKLVSGSHDSHIQVWSFPDCTPLTRLSGHKGIVADVAFSPDGLWLASGGTDHTLRLWDLTTPGKFTLLRGHRGGVLSVLFSQDGKELYSASDDGTVKVWPLTFAESTNLLRHSQWLNDVAFSPEGTLLAVGDHYARSTILWDLPTRTRIDQFQHTTNSIGLSIAFSPDGKLLAAAGQDKVAQVWNVSERKMIWEFPKAEGGGDPKIAIHPSKPILAVAWKDIRFWNLQNGSRINLLTEPSDQQVQSVAFSPDGKWIALGMFSGRVYLWNLATGQQSRLFEEHSDSVMVLCFSHDGHWLASGSMDNRIVLYDLRRQRAVAHLDGHTRYVVGLAFTPGDKSLVSTSWDGTAKFWCVASREVALTLAHDGGPISTVAFSPDGNLMATCGADGTVRLWPAVSRTESSVSKADPTKRIQSR